MSFSRIHWFELHELGWFPDFLKYQVTLILHLMWTMDFPEFVIRVYPKVHGIFKPRYIVASERISKTLKKLIEYYPNKEVSVMDMCSGGSGPNDIISRYVNKLLKEEIERPVKFYLSDLYPNISKWQKICSNNPFLSYVKIPVDITKPFKLPQADVIFQTFYLCYHHFTDDQVREILINSFESTNGFAIAEITERSIISIINVSFIYSIIFPLFVVPLFLHSLPLSIFITIYIFPVLLLVLMWDSLVSSLRTRSNEELMEFIKEFDTKGWEFQTYSDTIMYPFENMNWVIAVKKPDNNDSN